MSISGLTPRRQLMLALVVATGLQVAGPPGQGAAALSHTRPGASTAAHLGPGSAGRMTGLGDNARRVPITPAARVKVTKLRGFSTSPVTMRLGGEVAALVTISPRAVRAVSVQYQADARGPFRTLTRARTTSSGTLEVRIHPPRLGAWRVRLVVARAPGATALTSKARSVTVKGRAATSRLSGYEAAPATIALGAALAPSVTISPAGTRTVELQTRGPGAGSFTIASRGRSSGSGAFTTVFKPAALGVWKYRLVVRASATAKAATSAVRTVTVAVPTTGQTVPAPAPTPVPAVTPPIASLVGEMGLRSLRATVDVEVFFDGSGSGPGNGSPVAGAVLDFGDGSVPIGLLGDPDTWQFVYPYARAGRATATLTVLNAAGATATATLPVTIFDPPTILDSGPFAAVAKSPVAIPMAFDVPVGTRVTQLFVIFGDGTPDFFDGSGVLPATVTHTFDQPGLRSIEVDLCTDANFCGFGFLDVQVEPDKTTAFLNIAAEAIIGVPLSFTTIGSYAGPGATLISAVLSADDGVTPPVTVPPGSTGASITFSTTGARIVTLTVSDSLGGTGTFGAIITVIPPRLT